MLRQVEDDDHRVCHLALLSQYAVFKDIIPGYRIRVPTAAEKATKVSKDVHRMRTQEMALLTAYQVSSSRKCLEEVSSRGCGINGLSMNAGPHLLASGAVRLPLVQNLSSRRMSGVC